jgi:hypothetical protein
MAKEKKESLAVFTRRKAPPEAKQGCRTGYREGNSPFLLRFNIRI